MPNMKHSSQSRIRAYGFTLIEILVTLTILAILVSFAAPSFSNLIISKRIESHRSALQSTLAGARSAAITQGFNVIVCGSSDGASCSNDWQDGWISFVDRDNSSSVTANDIILQVVDQTPNQINVASNPNNAVIRFNSRGASNASPSFDFSSAVDNNVCRRLTIGLSGSTSLINNCN